MPPGRKPRPTALKILRGNPGRMPINHREPRPDPLSPDCPPELTAPAAVAEWHRLVPHLIAIGMVTAADRAILVGYCALWARWLQAHELKHHKAEHGVFVHLLRAMAEIGLTPASRSRVHAAPIAGQASAWADVLP